MSRAYRIRVRESIRRTLSAHDKAQSELELLDILPARNDGRPAPSGTAETRLHGAG